jgi:hypothetical protein
MALSESGLASQGVMPGPMIYGGQGRRITVRPKKGPASSGKQSRKVNFYVAPRKGRRK